MVKYTLLLVLLSFFFVVTSKAQESLAKETTDTTVYDVAEVMPSFPGGEAAMMKFIAQQLKYPEIAVENQIEGMVVAKFIIDIDGSIGYISIEKGIGGGCEEEVIRVIRLMPKWNPASVNGEPVRCYMIVPIKFSIHGNQSNMKADKETKLQFADKLTAAIIDDRYYNGYDGFFKDMISHIYYSRAFELFFEGFHAIEITFNVNKKGVVSDAKVFFAKTTSSESLTEGDEVLEKNNHYGNPLKKYISQETRFLPHKSQKKPLLIKFRVL
jgi:hypothetical protein